MPPKRSGRLFWFALDVDAFLDDDRTIRLSDEEQGQWLLLLLKMWRLGAKMPDDALFISRAIGMSRNKAIALKAKLEGLKLLVPDHSQSGCHYLISPKLTKEYAAATMAYEQRIEAGKLSAEKRRELAGTAQPPNFSNARPNDRSNAERTDID